MVGEIYLANINFTNAASSKVRPVLLIKANSFNDMVYLPLTTNISTPGYKIDNQSLREGFLPQSSIVVIEKPGVISLSLLIRKIGKVESGIYKIIIKELVDFLEY